MKKTLFYFSVFAIVGLLFTACSKDEPEFDEGLLISDGGKWKDVTKNEFFRYKADYTGVRWNEDEVTEEQGRNFNWYLEKSELGIALISVTTGEELVYHSYTVTELKSTTLKYKDDFESYSFVKVK